jgi:signal transduction histidine kinase
MNLGINAIHAMAGGGTLTVHTWSEGDMIHLEITDTGTGISKINLQRIFDPFFTTKDVGEGTGLGLSVSYSLIERMGGAITVESEEGKGTSFHIAIPDLKKGFEKSEEGDGKA